MPKPTSFKTTNKVFGQEGAYNDQIAACIMLSEDDEMSIVTKWKLSVEDMEILNETGELWLIVRGSELPPVSVFTKPPSEHGYRVLAKE